MKISDMIYELEKIYRQHGNVDVEFGYKCEEGNLVEAVELVEGVVVIE